MVGPDLAPQLERGAWPLDQIGHRHLELPWRAEPTSRRRSRIGNPLGQRGLGKAFSGTNNRACHRIEEIDSS